jgi:5-methylcytosine-specific restriction endonuclease McrA
MSLTLTSKTVQARKEYQCYYCGRRIEVDDMHEYRTGVDCGDFWTMRAHPECDKWAETNWDGDEYECHEPGDFPMLDLRHIKNRMDMPSAALSSRTGEGSP